MSRRLVIEADGGSRGNPGPAAYGSVVRDAETGELLFERGEYIGRATNNVAEYRGLIAALEAVREIDASADVDVRMDSKLVVEQMAGRWKVKHPDMVPLAIRARGLLPRGSVTWTWVPRERNKAADRMVNVALDAVARGDDGDVGGHVVPGERGGDEALFERPEPSQARQAGTRGAAAAREALRTGADTPGGAEGPESSRGSGASTASGGGSPARLVREFHEALDLVRHDRPDASVVPGDLARLRQDLLEEEVRELREAAETVDVVAVARELADVVYVAYGTALTYGIDLDAVLAEVHRANLSKASGAQRRGDGKVLKGDGFVEPDVAGVLGLDAPSA